MSTDFTNTPPSPTVMFFKADYIGKEQFQASTSTKQPPNLIKKKSTKKQPIDQEMLQIPEKCPKCSFVGKKPRSLVNHIFVKHPSKVTNFPCKVCSNKMVNKQFMSMVALKKHNTSVHIKTHPYICDHCGVNYKTAGNLQKHKISKHPKEVKRFTFEEFCQANPYPKHVKDFLEEERKVKIKNPETTQTTVVNNSTETLRHLLNNKAVKKIRQSVTFEEFLKANPFSKRKV
jgi:hypothetical protein